MQEYRYKLRVTIASWSFAFFDLGWKSPQRHREHGVFMPICIDFYCFPGCFLCELRVSVVKTHFNQNWRKSSCSILRTFGIRRLLVDQPPAGDYEHAAHSDHAEVPSLLQQYLNNQPKARPRLGGSPKETALPELPVHLS
jgi:hypothetical protein